MDELPYGGWVAPNIFYLGYSGCINVGGLRIAGAQPADALSSLQKMVDDNLPIILNCGPSNIANALVAAVDCASVPLTDARAARTATPSAWQRASSSHARRRLVPAAE